MDVRIERANEFENDSRFGTTQSAALRVTVTVCPLGRYECANVSVQARKQSEHEKTGSNTHTHGSVRADGGGYTISVPIKM